MNAKTNTKTSYKTNDKTTNSANAVNASSKHNYPNRPVGFFSSLKIELSAIIVFATAIAFVMAWFLLKTGLNGWIAMPLTLVVALGITYVFSRGLTAPLRQMKNAAEAMADGNYSVRVAVENRRDEVGKLTLAFNEMAEELEHADQMRRELIANVSHELRTPVSALQAMIENLADGVVDPTPSNMEAILNQTHRLADLITFLLDLSRVEAGAESLNITSFNFSEFLDEIIEPLEIADAGHNHHISIDIDNKIELTGDQGRLSQLFTNIISNALKHSDDGTNVLISAHINHIQNTLVSNVVNFGDQIPKEKRSDIFRRFVKGNQRMGTESGGTGLGLSIARWAAQLHHGTVKVVDDKRGPNFEITLPLNYNNEQN
ncbi:sensor histidine kinase [Gardnerella vaginalis]|uniref:sensor histidine kinase n=1 Tax=Gardnerella vaginalis TaxID=2702 RepID=UPI0039EF791F